MAPAPSDLASRLEHRIAKAEDKAVDAKAEDKTVDDEVDEALDQHSAPNPQSDDSGETEIPSLSKALTEAKALGDKAYIGSELIYVPHKRFKDKRFTKAKKDFNKLLQS